MAKTLQDYKSSVKPIWCAKCGHYGVLNSLYRAFVELDIDPANAVTVSGIGCSSRLPYFVNAYGFHGVHGRALPTAMGVKVANPELTVVATGGDGDGLAIGIGHFPHACRRNVDITYVMMDNFIYGLTKGQASPTTHTGHAAKASPQGPSETPIDPATLAITFGATYVARCFSGQPAQTAAILNEAIAHKGFSFIHVLGPCATFYDTLQICREGTAQLEEGYDDTNKQSATATATSINPIYLGVLYKSDQPVHVQGQPTSSLPERAERMQRLDKVFANYV